MAHFAAVRCAVFMRDTFLGYVWLDLYRFPLIDSEGLVLHVLHSESRN